MLDGAAGLSHFKDTSLGVFVGTLLTQKGFGPVPTSKYSHLSLPKGPYLSIHDSLI